MAAPPAELLRALAVLAEPASPAHEGLARALDLPAPPEGSGWADLFLFQLHPYASVHLGPEGMLGGEVRERIAGFWRAVGRTPPPEADHLSALLGLHAALRDEAAGHREAGEEAVAELVERSAAALLHEHLLPWLPPFLDRVEALGTPHQAAWAGLLRATLAAGPGAGPSEAPVHLRRAPELPDPRAEGGTEFAAHLLAPVRTGVLVTRHDLAVVARGLGLGLRAGERRYALDHLLGLDPSGTLEALAELARDRAESYRRWPESLERPRRFWVSRAERTAGLLQELAAEAQTVRSDPEAPSPS